MNQRSSPDQSNPSLLHDFSMLPYDVLARIAAAIPPHTLQAASLVCKSWNDALRPLREAVDLILRGKRYKRGRGVVQNLEKALDCYMKGTARGSTLAMVYAGLLYWEEGKKEEAIALYRRAAELGDPSA